MTSKLKYALLISFISSTALTSYASTQPTFMPVTHGNVNNTTNINKGHQRINTETVKMLKTYIHHEAPNMKMSNTHVHQKAPNMKIFKPFLVKSIRITLNNSETNLDASYKDYVGQKMTQESLTELTRKISDHFIKQNYLLPHVHISQHHARSGFLEIDVMPANIDNVVIVGEGEKNTLIREYANKILAEQPATVSNTQRYLALMNKIPGYEAHYQLKQNGDAVDLVVYTTKKKWSAYLGADSYGISELGDYQTSALAEVYSPFGGSDSILVHGSTSNHPNRLSDFGIGYSRPLNAYGTNIHLFAAHSEDNATKKDAVSAKNNTGNSFRVAFTHHLLLKAHEDLEVEAGAHYKNSKTYKVENNASTQHRDSKYWAGDLGLKYLFKDRMDGRNLFHTSYVQGLGDTFKNYIENDVADKNYSIGRFNFYREQPLQYNLSLFSHIAASYSGSTLPDAEKAILGGRDFGRGYEFGTLDGTRMIAFALEVRYTKHMEEGNLIKHIQPYLFHDIGNVGKQASDTNISTLESAGLGVRFRLDHGIDLGGEVAQPFKKNYTVESTDYKARTKYSFFVNKVFEF